MLTCLQAKLALVAVADAIIAAHGLKFRRTSRTFAHSVAAALRAKGAPLTHLQKELIIFATILSYRWITHRGKLLYRSFFARLIEDSIERHIFSKLSVCRDSELQQLLTRNYPLLFSYVSLLK